MNFRMFRLYFQNKLHVSVQAVESKIFKYSSVLCIYIYMIKQKNMGLGLLYHPCGENVRKKFMGEEHKIESMIFSKLDRFRCMFVILRSLRQGVTVLRYLLLRIDNRAGLSE